MSDQDVNQNGWNEWRRHVLKELERQNELQNKLSGDIADIKSRVTDYDPRELARLQIQLESLKKSAERVAALERKVEGLITKGAKLDGKWGILSVVGSAVIAVLVGWIFKSITPEPTKHPSHQSPVIIERKLTLKEIEALKDKGD